jgi:preprotein translocase subunit SecY
MIVFFCFFYTAVTFKPDDVAENLKKNGGLSLESDQVGKQLNFLIRH